MRPGEQTVVLSHLPRWYTTRALTALMLELDLVAHVDFVYVPNFGGARSHSKGYAVVNAPSLYSLAVLTYAFEGCWLPAAGSDQACCITKAKVQGWQNNCRYYAVAREEGPETRPYVVDLDRA